jgi:hypothetical protein
MIFNIILKKLYIMDDMIVLKKAINKRKQITGLKKCKELLFDIFSNGLTSSEPLDFESKFKEALEKEKLLFKIIEKIDSDNYQKTSLKLLSEYTGDVIILTYKFNFKY